MSAARLGRRKGFTLVELLVVVLIVGILGAAVSATLAAGIRAWERAATIGREEADVALAVAVVGRDFANHVPFSEVAFSGSPVDVHLGSMDSTTPGGATPHHVTYFYEPGAAALYRKAWRFRETEPPDGEGEQLLSHVSSMDFDYSYIDQENGGVTWHSDATNTPLSIRMTFQVDGPERTVRCQREFPIWAR